MAAQGCKQTVYFPAEMQEEIDGEMARLERTRSWLVQRAWLIARKQIRAMRPPEDPASGGKED